MGFPGVCLRLLADLVQALGGASRTSSGQHEEDKTSHSLSVPTLQCNTYKVDDTMTRALETVFGMQTNGRIKKEKAQSVVEKLGLIYGEEERESFELKGEEEGDEVAVQEVLSELEEGGEKRDELLYEAFKIFDMDGDGFIEAVELKRVLECLGLDKGWEISEIEKMVRVVDVNMDGKVDFNEFGLMMGQKSLVSF